MSTEKGRKAEETACRYLKRCGYQIIDRNCRAGRGELDIVAVGDDVLAFVEVKAHQQRHASLEAMHRDKCQRFISAAQVWLGLHEQYATYQCRFDLILVTPRKITLMPAEVEHMKDIIRL